MKLRNKILAIAVVAVAGVNIWKAAGDGTEKFDLSHWDLEKLAYADPTLTDIPGYEVFQNGDFVMIYRESGRVTYCLNSDQSDCPFQFSVEGNIYEFVGKKPQRDY